MQRWLILTFSLLVLLSILSGIAVWVGHQQPLPDHIAMLHFDMCEPPCWIGITPGKTALETALKQLKMLYPVNAGFETKLAQIESSPGFKAAAIRIIKEGDIKLQITFETVQNSKVIDFVSLRLSGYSLGQLLTVLIPPHSVNFFGAVNYFSLNLVSEYSNKQGMIISVIKNPSNGLTNL